MFTLRSIKRLLSVTSCGAVVGGVLTASGLVSAPAAAAPSSGPDPSFAGGPVVIDMGPGRDLANDIKVQPDGKVLVVGTADVSSTATPSKSDIFILRFLSDGTADMGFGSAGRVRIDRNGGNDEGNAVAVQPDGKILVAGKVDIGTGSTMAVFRLNPNGSLDQGSPPSGALNLNPGSPPFNGIVDASGSSSSRAKAIALQPDGKIVVAGDGRFDPERQVDYMVARLDSVGDPDPGFGSGGSTFTDAGGFQPSDNASDLAIQPDGRIIVGGTTSYPIFFGKTQSTEYFSVVRYNANGSVDTSFGPGGRVATDFTTGAVGRDGRLKSLHLIPDGRILAAGDSTSWKGAAERAPGLARYLAHGPHDASFGSGGTFVGTGAGIGYTPPNDMVVDRYGRIVTVGWASAGPAGADSALALGRFTPSGATDPTFGMAGWERTDLAVNQRDELRAVALQPDNNLMVAGTTIRGGEEQVVVARYLNGLPGHLAGWGYNLFGQLGDGSNSDRHVAVPVQGMSFVSAVAGGGYHSLAIGVDDRLWSWGYNDYGQLGHSGTSHRYNAIPVPGMTGITAVAGGGYHSLTVKAGRVWAWGLNYYGAVGDGTTTTRLSPTAVPNLAGVRTVSAGTFHSLAVRNDGTVWAWGLNNVGQLGTGTTTNSSSPVQVPGLTSIVAVSAGAHHSLALDLLGRVWSWGLNDNSQLARPGSAEPRYSPGMIGDLTPAMAISAGGFHNLMLRPNGTVWTWGYNKFGQLGDATTLNRQFPVQVSGGETTVGAIAAGGYHSIARRTDGTVLTWGLNYYGQLGDGTTADRSVRVGIGRAQNTPIAAGAYHSL